MALGLVRILHDRNAAALLDALEADRAVAVGAREHDRRGVRAVGVGQGAKEEVDGNAPAGVGRAVTMAAAAPTWRFLRPE